MPHHMVNSLIGGAERMSPDGTLAKVFDANGYPPEALPSWFGEIWRASRQPGAPLGNLVRQLVKTVRYR